MKTNSNKSVLMQGNEACYQGSYRSGRNIDINVIVFNNNIYGMIGGQFSPTTPKNARASKAVNGMIE